MQSVVVALLIVGGALAGSNLPLPVTETEAAALPSFTDPITSLLTPEAATLGAWSQPIELPVQGEDAVLLPTGEVLLFEFGSDAHLFDPRTGALTPVPAPGPINCVGIALMPDGRVLVNGGHTEENWHGSPASYIFDPFTRAWTQQPDLQVGRYYPTLLQLADGRMLTLSGNGPDGGDASVAEVFGGGDWTLLPQAAQHLEFYPRAHVLPGGDVVTAGQEATAYRLDIASMTWRALGTSPAGMRWGGTSTLLPDLQTVLVFGGGDLGFSSEGGITGPFRDNATTVAHNVAHGRAPATTSAQLLDTATGEWRDAAPLAYARRDGQAVLLANGDVLAVGGAYGAEPVPGWVEHSLSPELYDAEVDAWSTLAPSNRHRGYHSTSLLLPDGRVLVSGGDFETGVGSVPGATLSAEIFSPPYLFQGDRPRIVDAPTLAHLDAALPFHVEGDVDAVALVRLSSVTHSLNTDQRVVPLAYEAEGDGALVAHVPGDTGAVPPGWYMLVALRGGVPSEAAMVQLVPRGSSP
jgi:hypothetical protein